MFFLLVKAYLGFSHKMSCLPNMRLQPHLSFLQNRAIRSLKTGERCGDRARRLTPLVKRWQVAKGDYTSPWGCWALGLARVSTGLGRQRWLRFGSGLPEGLQRV